jgi:RNA recognition motif. (a.k.a. RRM, RBD, or RNP domain)
MAAPQRQLWLGNIPKNPNHSAIQQVFGHFGPLETVQTFPGKAFAGVKFVHAAHAANALENLDGIVVPPVTGGCLC